MATVRYDPNTGKRLKTGSSVTFEGRTYTQGSTAIGGTTTSSGGSSGGGSSSIPSLTTPINIDSNPSQTLAPGQVYTYQGKTYTQPGATSSPTPTPTLPSNTAGTAVFGSSGQYVYNVDSKGVPYGSPLPTGTPVTTTSTYSATPAPITQPVETIVPEVAPILDLPKEDNTLVESYLKSLPQQLADMNMRLDNQRNTQLEQIQNDRQAAQDQYNEAMTNANTVIMEEQKRKLEAYELNMARYNKAYEEKQGFVTQLTALMTQGNELIASQKATTGLTSIRNPRVNATIADISGKAAVIQAGINASEFDMNSSNSIIQTAMSALTSIYENQINYYSTIAETADKKLITLTADEKDFVNATITDLQNQRDNIQKNVDYIQQLMISPESASFMAKAGVSLTDSPEVINQKMAAQTLKDELVNAKNEMVTDGYTYVPFPTSTAGLVPITAGGKTMYFKAPPEKVNGTTVKPTEAERQLQGINNISSTLVLGATLPSGETIINPDGQYINPGAWIEMIKHSPEEGVSRKEFLTNFGSYLFIDKKTGKPSTNYNLTPTDLTTLGF